MNVRDILSHFLSSVPYKPIFGILSYCVDDSDDDIYIYFPTSTLTPDYIEFIQKYKLYIVEDWIYDTSNNYLHLTLTTPK